MLNKLDYKKKQLVLLAGVTVTLYAGYHLSFKKAFAAYQLNRSLGMESVSALGQPSSYHQMEEEDVYYKSIIKSYKVGKTDRENFLWQKLSALAITSRVEINYVRDKEIATDSTTIIRGIVSDAFTFNGNYNDLVKLLDTISKSQGIGRIHSLTLSHDKKNELKNKEKLTLTVNLNGILYNDDPDGVEN